MKVLIKPNNLFIGDQLFSTSVADRYKETFKNVEIHYVTEFPQLMNLFENHPNIDNVWFKGTNESYDKIIDLNPLSTQSVPATVQFQVQSGIPIEMTCTGFYTHTNEKIDEYVRSYYETFTSGKKIVCWQRNWEERSFLFTPEEYKAGIDVPNYGYGGKRRNIYYVISELSKNENLILIPVGKPSGYNQRTNDINACQEYTELASLIKYADYLIGSEGGITNLGCSIKNSNCKCIITTDFILQLYGWNGCIRKHQTPTMGPNTYFPNSGHVHLDPYLTDEQLVKQLNELLK